MPARDHATRFSEHEEENAIHDRERFIEQHCQIAWSASAEPGEKVLDRRDDAKPQRTIYRLPMASRRTNNLEHERVMLGASLESLRTEQSPEDAERRPAFDGVTEVEFDVRARVRALRVDETHLPAIRAQRPRGLLVDPMTNGGVPETVERSFPLTGNKAD
jgi:hypothetical protein